MVIWKMEEVIKKEEPKKEKEEPKKEAVKDRPPVEENFQLKESRKVYLNEISVLKEHLIFKDMLISDLQIQIKRLISEMREMTYAKRKREERFNG